MKNLPLIFASLALTLIACTSIKEKEANQAELERVEELIQQTKKEIAPYRAFRKGSGITEEERAALGEAISTVYTLREQGLNTTKAEAIRNELELSTIKAVRERERSQYEALKKQLNDLLARKDEIKNKI